MLIVLVTGGGSPARRVSAQNGHGNQQEQEAATVEHDETVSSEGFVTVRQVRELSETGKMKKLYHRSVLDSSVVE
ncbi:MAG: hypothetical protein QM703_16835 [Gemmatales bacterium]